MRGGAGCCFFSSRRRHTRFDCDWSSDVCSSDLEAKNAGIDVRALVSINPGNPTGVSLEESNVRQILEFSQENKLVVLADEVYQTNVFDLPFHSFRKVLLQMQHERPDQYHIELASIHSISKGELPFLFRLAPRYGRMSNQNTLRHGRRMWSPRRFLR